MKCLAIYEFRGGSRLYWCHCAWRQCWHLLSLDFSSYQSIRFESYMALGDVEVLEFVLRLHWPQQSRDTRCQRAAVEQGLTFPFNGMRSLTWRAAICMWNRANSSMRFVDILLEDKACLFNSREINFLHFERNLL